jgi:hypothetical protein
MAHSAGCTRGQRQSPEICILDGTQEDIKAGKVALNRMKIPSVAGGNGIDLIGLGIKIADQSPGIFGTLDELDQIPVF